MKKKRPRKLYWIFQLGIVSVIDIQKIKGVISFKICDRDNYVEKLKNWKIKTTLDFLLGNHRYSLPNKKHNKIWCDSFFYLSTYCAVWSMLQYTNDFLLPLIYKRGHLFFANCSINFHMNKFLVSMLLQFISCLVGNHQTTKLGVYTRFMFSAGIMSKHFMFSNQISSDFYHKNAS